jgi:uncharacterized protein YdiU (UPF0061 family)
MAARENHALLEQLVDFTIARDFPYLTGDTAERRAAWFLDVCERTARMIVHWMRVGFVHGVMNTDNMSILGLTIDYGPYGWIDNFDPNWTPNTTDASGRRYRFGQQPAIAQWNVTRLAEAIAPVFTDEAPLHAGLEAYHRVYATEYDAMNRSKFGFRMRREEDDALMREAFALLYDLEADYTRFFRGLGAMDDATPTDEALDAFGRAIGYDDAKREAHVHRLHDWVQRWHARVSDDGETARMRRARMHALNPQYVLRNYLAQQAIDAAEGGDLSLVHELLDVMRRPYDEQPGRERFAERRPDWARTKAGCSMLSCSS